MTALDMINKSLGLLGYGENNNNTDLTQRVINRALPLVNLVYSDMRAICDCEHREIKTLSEEIELPEKAYNVMACGLASYIGGAEGDDSMQGFWAAEYESRKTTLTRITQYKDVLPRVEG